MHSCCVLAATFVVVVVVGGGGGAAAAAGTLLILLQAFSSFHVLRNIVFQIPIVLIRNPGQPFVLAGSDPRGVLLLLPERHL